MICNVCPRNCNIDRQKILGFCKSKSLKINKVMVHYFEEPVISGENDRGSGTIFFCGCNLKCLFCQNYNVSHENNGIEISVLDLVNIFKKLEEKGVNNINLVTPTHYALEIIEALKIYKPKIPIVYNTSGYEKPETISLLKDYVDIFLFDLKYYDSKISLEYSKAKDYFEYAFKSLIIAKEFLKEDVIENGIMKKGVIVRHMVLPKNSTDSINIINKIYEKFNTNIILSVLNQYTPCYKALEHKILKNKVTDIEYKRVVKHLINLNFEKVFVQDSSSSSTEFIPNFNEKFSLKEFLEN